MMRVNDKDDNGSNICPGMTQRHQFLLLLFLLLGSGTPAAGQSLVLGTVDTSEFPHLRAPVVAFDPAGLPLPLSNNDSVTVEENGLVLAAGRLLTCPQKNTPRPVSIVLVLDRSGSMGITAGGLSSRLDVMKAGVRAFLRTLDFSNGTTVGVTEFDDLPLILHTRSADRGSLEASIAALALGGGTQFTPAFLDTLTGGISLLAGATAPRHFVFITDGEPFQQPDGEAIIAAARAAGVTVHVVTIATRLTEELKTIADATGGSSIGDVVTGAGLAGYLASLAGTIQETPSCSVAWRAPTPCGSSRATRSVSVTVAGVGMATSWYIPPNRLYPALHLDTLALWFGAVAPGGNSTRQITIRAEGVPFTVDGISPTLPPIFSVTSWGGPPPPFVLQPGASRTVTLRFAPTDSVLSALQISFAASPCPSSPLLLGGGVPGKRIISGLRLVEPTGGTRHSACEPVTIIWSGVSPDRPIRIEASGNGGNSWFRVADSARGLRYHWSPPGPGTAWRLRIATLDTGVDSIFRAAGGGVGPDGGPATLAQLVGPTGVQVIGNQLYIVESGRHRVRRVFLEDGVIQTIAGTGSPGYSGDGGQATLARLANPNDIALDSTTLYIADATNNVIRAVDLATGLIRRVAGTGEQGFAGDGGPALDAQFNLPSFLARAPGALYVTDRVNGRVRRIDLRTGRITTVAGGGLQPEGDGGPATAVRLVQPAGIAWENGTLYVVEQGRHRVRSVASDGGVMTVAGSGVAGDGGDGGPLLDARFNAPTGIDVRDSVLLLADEGNNVIRKLDLRSNRVSTVAGTGRAGFQGDDGPARTAQLDRPYSVDFTPWGYAIADLGNDWVRIVVESLEGLADSTPTFAVARARLTVTSPGRAFTFDTTAANVTRSEVLAALLCNRGDIASTPDTARIVGDDAGAFRISSGLTGTPLLPGECATIEILFTPAHVGPHSAAIIFGGSCSEPDTLWLTGTGRTDCGIAMTERVEISAALGGRADSTVKSILCNTGAKNVSGTLIVESPDGAFTVSSGTGRIVLPPGGCHTLSLRFTPNHTGLHVARLRFESDGGCGVAGTLLVGTGRPGGSISVPETLRLPPLLCAGDTATMRVPIINGSPQEISITELDLLPSVPPFTVISDHPSPASPITVAAGDSTVIAVRYRPLVPGADTLHLRAVVARVEGDTTLAVTLTGRLEQIHLLAEPESIDYPLRNQQQNDSTVVITNRGTIPVTIDSASVTPSGVQFALAAVPRGVVLHPDSSLTLVVISLDTEMVQEAALRITYSPSCGAPPLHIPLVQMQGQTTLVAASPLDFTLPCGSEVIDTAVTLINLGTEALTIGSATLGPSPISGGLDLVRPHIAPGDSGRFRLRATVPGTGDRRGVLQVLDTAGRVGARLPITFHQSTPSLLVEPAEVVWRALTLPIYGTHTVTLTNTGATTLDLALTSIAPAAVVVDNGARFTLEPGATREVRLRVVPEALRAIGGTTSLLVRDLLCGVEWPVVVRGEFEKIPAAIFQLPHTTVAAGTPVLLPIQVTERNRSVLDTMTPPRVRVEIVWDGTTMRFDSVIGAIAPASYAYNSQTGKLFVIFDVTLDEHDTVATIAATTLIGGSPFSAVRFDSIEVLHTSLTIAGIDGSMTLTGDCRTLPPRISTRPHLVKIAPNPASTSLNVTVDLDNTETVGIDLLRSDGTLVGELALPTLYSEGRHTISLPLGSMPGGAYILRVATPGGEAAAPLVIQR